MFDNSSSKAILDLIRPGFQFVCVAAVDTVSHLQPHSSVVATTSLAYNIACRVRVENDYSKFSRLP
jgi:hypothetical protein